MDQFEPDTRGVAPDLRFLPYSCAMEDRARLPGVQPLGEQPFLLRGPDFAGQMAVRAEVLAQRLGQVCQVLPEAEEACAELLEHVIAALDDGYLVAKGHVTRPDGVQVSRNLPPLVQLGHLVQEDFCVLAYDQDASEHVLQAAVLCFPAGWRLADKIGRPLVAIHAPVPEYAPDLAKRVQRLFDGVQVGRPLWRANALTYTDPTLFQPQKTVEREGPQYLRTERQVITRLPRSQAVVFSIRTSVARVSPD